MNLNIGYKSAAKPGLTQVLYAIYDELETIGEPVPSTTPESKVTVTASHTFSSEGNGFRKIFLNPKKSTLEFIGAGDEYSGSGECRLKLFYPGDEKAWDAFILLNPELLILVQKNPCQTGGYWQVGTKCNAANIDMGTVKWTSGTVDGKTTMGWEFDVMAVQATKLHYEGTVTLATE